MGILETYNRRFGVFQDITGEAMKVHAEYHNFLVESAYETALKYLLEQKGFTVKNQVDLPMYWKDVKLDKHYRMDLVVNGNIIVELKAVNHVDTAHRRQLWSYMHLTHTPYGMIINFGGEHLYSEWYYREAKNGSIQKISALSKMISAGQEAIISAEDKNIV